MHNPSYLTLHNQPDATLSLDRVTCWEIYHRLQALDIPCECRVQAPLTVTVDSPLALLQLWSVVKACTDSKADLADHLHRCWQQRSTP